MKKLIISLLTSCLLSSAWGLALKSPTEFSPKTAEQWVDLETKMILTKDKDIILEWTGTGGYVKQAEEFYKIIQKVNGQGKQVTLIVSDGAASSHAFILCLVDRFVLLEGAVANFHAGYNCPGNDLAVCEKLPAKDRDYSINDPSVAIFIRMALTKCVDKGFLSIEQVKRIMIDHKMIVFQKVNGVVYSEVQDDQ